MPRLALLLALAAIVPTLAACTGPYGGMKANDTGGIISWYPAEKTEFGMIAGEHCARYGKLARIVSIDARYGGYVSFSCAFDARRH